MALQRLIKCDIPGCTAEHLEEIAGGGWPGWGQLKGINFNNRGEPYLCPRHLGMIANFIDGGSGSPIQSEQVEGVLHGVD